MNPTAKKQAIIEKLQSIRVGDIIRINASVYTGHRYEVRSVELATRKNHIVKACLTLHEVGKPETHIEQGVGLAKGKTFEISYTFYFEIYANNSISWRIEEKK